MGNSYGRQNREKIMKMTTLAILVAIVIVFQWLGSFIHITPNTSVTLVLVPIVLGGIILGPACGAFLGLIFGIMTLWAGVSGTDPFTNTLFVNQPYATSAICLGKAVLAGWCFALIYKLIAGKNKVAAAIAAAAAAPIINTGIFILGGLFLVSETLSANFVAEGTTLVYFVIIGCAGLNFVGEFIANIILSPAIITVSNAIAGIRKKSE